MATDWIEEQRVKAPDVAAAFERARAARKKELETPKPELELRPPAPAPGGLVSPQLRRDQKVLELKKAMLAAREFRRAARDGIER